MKKALVTTAVLLTLTGCASNQAAIAERRAAFEKTIPTCSTPPECKAKWEAAQRWIVKNLPLKIQTISDVVIETYGPGQYGAETAARVLKDPVDSTTYRIIASLYCNNPLGCFPEPWQAAFAFNEYVNAAPIPEAEPPHPAPAAAAPLAYPR